MRDVIQTPTPRKDQLRNRAALVEAARSAFVSDGAEINLDQIARRAGMAASTLYRHFPTKDDLVEAVLDEMIQPALAAASRAAEIPDPADAFRLLFTQSCTMPEDEVATFAQLSSVSRRTFDHAHRLIVNVVGPATLRLQAVGGLRHDLTTDDIAAFVRMVGGTDSPTQRQKALEVLLAGMQSTVRNESDRPHHPDQGTQSPRFD